MNQFAQMVAMSRGNRGNQSRSQMQIPDGMSEDPAFVADMIKLIARRGGDWRAFLTPTTTDRQVGSHEFAQAPMYPGPQGQSFSQNMAMVPRVWKSAPEHEPAVLAYVTPTEMDMLRNADIYGSNIRERMHYGPGKVPSLQGDGPGGSDGGGGPDSGGPDGPDGMDGSGDAGMDGTPGGIAGSDDAAGAMGGLASDHNQDGAADAADLDGGSGYRDTRDVDDYDMEGTKAASEKTGAPVGQGFMGVVKDVANKTVSTNTALNGLLGFLGLAAPPIGLGMLATQAMDKLGVDRDARGKGGENESSGGQSGDNGGPILPPGQGGTPPGQAKKALFTRPQERGAPSFLSMHPAMSNLQRRAQISTFATQGRDSRYRDTDTENYWKNLIQRDLISDAGQLAEFGNVLPIELQYIQQVLGKGSPTTTQSLLEAIAAS